MSCNEVINELMEITKKVSAEEELSEETLEDINIANKQYASGKGFSTQEILKLVLKKRLSKQ